MRKIAILIALALSALSANAVEWFPFGAVNRHKWNISLQGGYNHRGDGLVVGGSFTVRGFYFMLGGLGSTHERDTGVSTWTENASITMHVGYQIPIARGFRIVPKLGVAGTGTVTTYGDDWSISHGSIKNETSTDMTLYFDYGVNVVFNHRKLLITLGISRCTYTGGIGLEF